MAAPLDWSDPPPPRWYARPRSLIILFVVLVAGGGVAGGLIGATHRHHRTAPRHHVSTLFVTIQFVVLAVALALIVTGLIRQRRAFRRQHMTFWPPSRGLPWRARRQLTKAVRHGHPAADPARRRYELDIAHRVLVGWQVLPYLGTGVGLIFVVRVFEPDSPIPLRAISLCAVLLLITTVPFAHRNVRRARRFLSEAGQSQTDPVH